MRFIQSKSVAQAQILSNVGLFDLNFNSFIYVLMQDGKHLKNRAYLLVTDIPSS